MKFFLDPKSRDFRDFFPKKSEMKKTETFWNFRDWDFFRVASQNHEKPKFFGRFFLFLGFFGISRKYFRIFIPDLLKKSHGQPLYLTGDVRIKTVPDCSQRRSGIWCPW